MSCSSSSSSSSPFPPPPHPPSPPPSSYANLVLMSESDRPTGAARLCEVWKAAGQGTLTFSFVCSQVLAWVRLHCSLELLAREEQAEEGAGRSEQEKRSFQDSKQTATPALRRVGHQASLGLKLKLCLFQAFSLKEQEIEAHRVWRQRSFWYPMSVGSQPLSGLLS